jgi:monofunctional biosynthetic peptidoglycan transglycosylase
VRKLRVFGRKLKAKFRKKSIFIWLLRLALVAAVIDAGYLAAIWPNWTELAAGQIPESTFIKNYKQQRTDNNNLPALRWSPVGYGQIPRLMRRTVVVAEDSRFYSQGGIYFDALKEVMAYNCSQKNFLIVGSTNSQQTVKNLFLNSSRNPLRKWHEVILTLAMERNLKKSTIINLYLNVAEFGQGIYGVEAASRYYWGKSAAYLTQKQAIELAATLPAPLNHNPGTRSSVFII